MNNSLIDKSVHDINKSPKKIFITYDEQIALLKERGLLVLNENAARSHLKQFGYYDVVNGYKEVFLKRDSNPPRRIIRPELFIPGYDFDDLIHLHLFDNRLRSIIQEYLVLVEKSLKSTISYYFSERYGENHHLYLKPSSFKQKPNDEKHTKNVTDLIRTFKDLIKDNYYHDKGGKQICHYIDNHDYVPLWVLFTVASFGNVSIFFKNLNDDDQNLVANEYGLSGKALGSIVYFLTGVRNFCAHGHRMYILSKEWKRPRKIPRLPLHSEIGIKDSNIAHSDVLATIFCCFYLLPNNDFETLIHRIESDLDFIHNRRFYSSVLNMTHLFPRYLKKLIALKLKQLSPI